ncbi:unnamed protein product [Sphenostylis stenocarpa]|uniref:Protein kinase domain-containing protein n=1 Tax=Sphenostylis stenocarpa TaxID=92480 RepID=A0AA86T9X3_9FABA|nr:unnamed protein product [Sphenostylis stenocarpa]
MSLLFSSCSSSQSKLASVTIILVLFQQACFAKHHPSCTASSCGKIRNITYPFRLKGDPEGCGLPSYELDCVNNVTELTLFSGKYYVHDIDYKRYLIQLTDAGVVDDTACSIPRYFLSSRNFTYVVGPDYTTPDPLTLWHNDWNLLRFEMVGVLNCTNPVTDDPRYVEVDSGCDSGGHIYMVFSSFRMEDIKIGCYLKVATFANKTLSYNRNVSYADIHKSLVEGFSLSWVLPVTCKDRCRKGIRCIFNETSEEVECDPQRYCHYVYRTTTKCGITSKILVNTLGFLKGIIIGLLSRLTFSTKQLNQPVSQQYFDGAVYIGRNIVSAFIAARYLFGVALLLGLFIYKWQRRHLSMYENIENFLVDNHLNPIRYEYREIKKMTGGFKVKLGQGGFGSVYKGKLRSGPDVAVKMLNKSKANGQDFINEVATIGRIHHTNVVRLIGYCVEGKKRALVYEYMPNGSLDKYIFSKEGSFPLSYAQAYEISLGIALGISYLHQGCDVQILHFDIKPHNILLDDRFIPKVSDFGLAKLYPVDDSIVTLTDARGTLGYMAPELFYKNVGGVSFKADIYSFGMLLMEMTSRRKNSNPHAEHSSQNYFPLWIYDQFKEEKDIEMDDFSKDEKCIAKKMFLVALWCIQLKPMDRPSMNKVIEMLEGETENLIMPSRPSFYPNEISEMGVSVNSNQTSWNDSTDSDTYLGETTNSLCPT